MAVRNFHVDCTIDGAKTRLSGGPRNKDGGLVVSLKQRDNGQIFEAVSVFCRVNRDGKLQTTIEANGETIEVITDR